MSLNNQQHFYNTILAIVFVKYYEFLFHCGQKDPKDRNT